LVKRRVGAYALIPAFFISIKEVFMKNSTRLLAIIALAAAIGFTMTGCDDGSGSGDTPDLPGTIVISSPVGKATHTVGDTLTATYTTTGTETVSYQWKRDGSNVGTDATTYTTDQAGSYTVTVSAQGYKSKTSAAVTVTGPSFVVGETLAEKLTWFLNEVNVQDGETYTIELDDDEAITPQTLSYDNRSNITIILKGTGEARVISLPDTDNGTLFTVESGVTLVLDENITLQGKDTNNASLVKVNSGGTLEMKTGAKITDNKGGENDNGGVFVNGGTFIMDGGEISGNSVFSTTLDSGGGGVKVINSGTFTMNGGKISGNITNRYGGGVALFSSSTFIMNDGEISGNTASSYNGGGVYVDSRTFTMNDGKISGNTASDYGGGVYVNDNGTFNMKGGEISGNSTSSSASGNGGGIAVRGTFRIVNGIVYGSGAAADKKNTADNGSALYFPTGWANYGTFSGPNDAWVDAGNLETTESTIEVVDGMLVWESFLTDELERLLDEDNVEDGKTYTITLEDEDRIGPQTLSYDNRSNITIVLKGSGETRVISHLTQTSPLFTVGSGVTLVLDENITLQGRNNFSSQLVKVDSGGALEMKAGATITGSNRDGVRLDGGTFTMDGGKISANNNYGGVYISSGTFTMNDGEISGNRAMNSGAGVYVRGTFTMNGGKISGNSTDLYGGGVYISSGTFIMNDGEISGNRVSASNSGGGGVNVDSYSGTFTMKGGKISGNTATSGGGVYVNTGTLHIVTGTIYGSDEADEDLKNTIRTNGSGAALYVASVGATADHGTFSGTDGAWVSTGTLTTTEDTIEVTNGVLQ
jgi:hypothetical protein